MGRTFEDSGWGDDEFALDRQRFLDLPPEVHAAVRRITDEMRTPLAAGDPRRHHWVPQFYLRRFAQDDRLAVTTLDSPEESVIRSVGDVAVMRDLYTTVDVDVGETVAVERVLALADSEASSALERLAYGVLFPPQARDREALALWLSLLHVRGPEQRRSMEAMADHAIKLDLSLIHDEDSAAARLGGEAGDEPDPELVQGLLETVDELGDLEFVPHQNEFIQQMLDIALSMTPQILKRFWTVMKFPEPGLVLTDKPLTLHQNPASRPPHVGVGIVNADEIWLPLDRRTALILHHLPEVGEDVVAAPPRFTVDDVNQAVVSQMGREIYCHPDDVDRVRRLRLPAKDRALMHVTGADWIKVSVDGVNVPPNRKRHRRYRRQ